MASFWYMSLCMLHHSLSSSHVLCSKLLYNSNSGNKQGGVFNYCVTASLQKNMKLSFRSLYTWSEESLFLASLVQTLSCQCEFLILRANAQCANMLGCFGSYFITPHVHTADHVRVSPQQCELCETRQHL